MSKPYKIIRATKADNALIVDNFYKMWQDYDLEKTLDENWQTITQEFINDAIDNYSYAGFLLQVDNKTVATAACQLFNGLYPNVFIAQERKYGYIWAVFVERAYRRKGLAKAITSSCNNYLKEIGCTKVLLHASPMGKPVYESLGFASTNEMYLDLP